MLRHKTHPAGLAGDVIDALRPYADQLANDPKLRRRLVKGIQAGAAAGARARRESTTPGTTRRLASDPVLLAQIARAIVQFQRAYKRVEQPPKKRHTRIYVIGAAAVAVVVLAPAIRSAINRGSAAEVTTPAP